MTQKIKIFIDPGHGGNDPGAVSNGMRESDITLEVSKNLADLLKLAGLEVRLSRTEDRIVPLNDRWQAANAWGADYFISIHVNAGRGTGSETFIAATKPQDRAFATAINDVYAKTMSLRNRGVKLDTEAAVGSLGVLRLSHMPAILVELGFIDSPANNPDVDMLRNKRPEMAAALANGLLQFLDIDLSDSGATSSNDMPGWAVDAWEWATKIGLTDGTRPRDPVTRQEVMTLLYRFYSLLKEKPPNP